MQLYTYLFHIIKFCFLFCIFLTSQSEVDFGIALVVYLLQIDHCNASDVQM